MSLEEHSSANDRSTFTALTAPIAVLRPHISLVEPLMRLGVLTVGALLALPTSAMGGIPGVGRQRMNAFLRLRREARAYLRCAGVPYRDDDPVEKEAQPELAPRLVDRLIEAGVDLD